MKKTDTAQPLSATAYALIALAGLVMALGFTFFYVHEVPRLVQSGTQGQVFYLLLLPWALSCAAFLFGVMRSYASLTYKDLGNFLELGGPVVLFCLVLVGGHKLVPSTPETFDLTVRAHSADGGDPIITSGKITIDFGTNRTEVVIDAKGEANFKGVPARFRDSALKVWPQVDGYEEKPQYRKPEGQVLDLALERTQPVTVLIGSIVPPPGLGKIIRIVVDGQEGEASPDELGRFKLTVNRKVGDMIRLKAYSGKKLVYDDYQVLSGSVTINLEKAP